jgi:Bacterial pre-peptidase C-terminal domain
LVYYQQACAGDTPADFTINVSVDGTALSAVSGTVQPGQVFAASFEVNADGSSNIASTGGLVVLENIPFNFADVQANALPIEFDIPLPGTITNDQPFQSYTFEGLANQLVTLSAFATTGSLDTFVGVLDAQGNLIAFNDDLAQGVTDSQIGNALLPSSGTFYVIVTRYGKTIGGTEGTYDLTLSQQVTNLSQDFLSLPEGSLEVLLLWNTAADMQLLVRDSAGDAVFDDIPAIQSGGQLAAAGNVNCRISEGTPFSYVYWPQERQPRPGAYEVEVWYQANCNDVTPVTFNLYITLNGRQVFRDTSQPILNERYLTSFTINADGTSLPSDGGIIRGLETLDYLPDLATAAALNAGEPAAGSITTTNKFDVYTYSGTANESINLAMNATSGTLDTTLYLVSPSGVLIAENDDAVAGENTNSLIADFTLPEDGQYIIITTHYGAQFGGTTGTYTLTLTRLS